MRIDDTFGFLLGDWAIQRTIADHRTGRRGGFDGIASVHPSETDPRSARYGEVGRLRYGTYDGAARRELQYLGLETGAVLINFSDRRPFFVLDLRSGSGRAEHPCREDDYTLEFDVRSESLVWERWHVHGPLKHYTAHTRWQRRTADAERDDQLSADRSSAHPRPSRAMHPPRSPR